MIHLVAFCDYLDPCRGGKMFHNRVLYDLIILYEINVEHNHAFHYSSMNLSDAWLYV